MTITLTESQLNFLKEDIMTNHFYERLLKRLYYDKYDVVFKGKYDNKDILEIVGEYRLTDEQKQNINKKINILDNMDIPKDQTIGFIVHHFDINGPDDIIIKNENDRTWLRKILPLTKYPNFFVLDPSRGQHDYQLAHVIMAVIKDGKLITIKYTVKSRITPNRTSEFDYIGDDIMDLKRYLNKNHEGTESTS